VQAVQLTLELGHNQVQSLTPLVIMQMDTRLVLFTKFLQIQHHVCGPIMFESCLGFLGCGLNDLLHIAKVITSKISVTLRLNKALLGSYFVESEFSKLFM
jgi:hypothetical protein